MSLYASLGVSPRKKRVCSSSDDDATPKRRRVAHRPPTPPPSKHKHSRSLPSHLARLETIHAALQHALSHALATCAVSPSEQTGIIRNVLNHLSIATYSGFTTKFHEHDLKRLCWIWEWDSSSLPIVTPAQDDPNPFLVPPPPKDWTRGSMGFVISPTSHYSKTAGKRVPAFGIGIEVEMDIDKGMTGGMAAVARWTADADKRRAEFRSKLDSWVNVLRFLFPISFPTHLSVRRTIPEPHPSQMCPWQTYLNSSFTQPSLRPSPESLHPRLQRVQPPWQTSFPPLPSSPSKSTGKTREFPVPFPIAKPDFIDPSPSKISSSLLRTPSSRLKRVDPLAGLLTPQTPARKRLLSQSSNVFPTTPVHQRGPDAQTAPSTPSTSRRQALYDRVHLKSLTSTPVKAKSAEVAGGKLTRDQIQKLGQEEIRRRCLLGRLGGVAESIWMLFSSPVGPTAAPTTRKRKALPASEVIAAVVKSSLVPMSTSESSESLKLLTTLCPFFLRPLDINGEEWLEMPPTASTSDTTDGSPVKRDLSSPTKPSGSKMVPPPSPGSKLLAGGPPASPGSKLRLDTAKQLLTRSPRRVKREAGGIREVREIIRRELELHD
ncbi:hypothetical protein JVT61DRAFT_13141 [Boletus reticuloceps]|uniref:DNA replication factor Cdt1 C-terminal domain-containing protein n=1 Tax=Boletus reticuloceps TaxID=495285 RepID=A0A8I3ADY2_9AGAM|nr:hypothetical protein JVT61DRAFT_13141 [Boletus reticuloceps]